MRGFVKIQGPLPSGARRFWRLGRALNGSVKPIHRSHHVKPKWRKCGANRAMMWNRQQWNLFLEEWNRSDGTRAHS